MLAVMCQIVRISPRAVIGKMRMGEAVERVRAMAEGKYGRGRHKA